MWMNFSGWAKRLRIFLSTVNAHQKLPMALLIHCCQLDFIPFPELVQRAYDGQDEDYAWG